MKKSKTSAARRDPAERLGSWKEIAVYLGSSVRTVQRWEKEEGLPVHRQQHAKLASIHAYKSELEAWRSGRTESAPGSQWSREESDGHALDWRRELDAIRERLSQVAPFRLQYPSRRDTGAATVGRRPQLEQMLAALAAVEVGGSLMLSVAGEPGIGKTTLLDAFLAGLARDDAAVAVARGRCSERLAGNEAYLPWLEALENLLALPDGEAVGRLMRLVAPTWYVQIAPLWAASDPVSARVMEDAKAASRERMKRELLAFFRELSASRPVVLLFDDLHWADASTVEMIAYLAQSAASMRILGVVAYRQSDMLLADHTFLSVKRDLEARGLCREVSMGLLAESDVAAYLDLTFPGHAFPASLASAVHARTGGNPLFMADLLRHLAATGVIAAQDRGFTLTRDPGAFESELPQSVRSMVERKIERLGEEGRRLLVAAAVEGGEFETAVVADATGAEPVEVEARLRELSHVHDVVRLVKSGELADGTLSQRYAFVHVLYQGALDRTLTPSARADLSRRVAESLRSHQAGHLEAVATRLAYLFEAARDFREAARFFLMAAEAAMNLFAFAEAEALTKRAMTSAEQIASDERLTVMLEAAFVRVRMFFNQASFERVIEASRLAEELACEAGDKTGIVEAICGIANALCYLKRNEESIREAERALGIAREHAEAGSIANAQSTLARVLLSQGELDDAVELFEAAIPVLDSSKGSLQAIDAVGYRMLVHAWRLEYREFNERARWWETRARENGLATAQLYFYRGMALGNAGRISEALSVLEHGIRQAELHHDIYHLCRLPNTLGWVHRLAGDLSRALELDLESRDLARELGFEEAEANAHVNIAHDCLRLGEPDRAFDHLQHAERIFKEDVWFRWRYNIRLQIEKAAYWLQRGDLAIASSSATAASQLASKVLARKHMAAARKILGDIAVLEDRPVEARREYTAAARLLSAHPCPSLELEIQRALAGAAVALNDADAADEARRAARRLAEALAATIDDEAIRRRYLLTAQA